MDTIDLHSINPWEVSFLREEVGAYFAHGVELAPGATVLDVGANIGVFSAAVYERLDGDVRIYAFEPLPPLHATLERNGRDFFGGRLKALPYGLAAAAQIGVIPVWVAVYIIFGLNTGVDEQILETRILSFVLNVLGIVVTSLGVFVITRVVNNDLSRVRKRKTSFSPKVTQYPTER